MAKRLQKEARTVAEANLDWGSAEPVEDDLFHWTASVIGPEGTPFEDGVFNLDLKFPSDYPYSPPTVVFSTPKVYHPSIKQETGEICQDLIKNQWNATKHDVLWILQVIRSMLQDPNSDSPLEPEIANQLQNDFEAYKKQARENTAKYAA